MARSLFERRHFRWMARTIASLPGDLRQTVSVRFADHLAGTNDWDGCGTEFQRDQFVLASVTGEDIPAKRRRRRTVQIPYMDEVQEHLIIRDMASGACLVELLEPDTDMARARSMRYVSPTVGK
jgi:hypothetical protein